ncbi:MAG: ABC transporter permease [Lachnospiraceae bacterium]
MSKKPLIRYIIILIFILAPLSLFVGVKDVTFAGLLRMDEEMLKLFVISRIPRLIAILCVGMSLSVAGAIMQSIMSNRFVSPSTASTMDWAKFGILVAIMLFPSANVITKMLISTAFAFLGSLLFIRLLRVIKLKDQALVPLVGMMLGSVVTSLTTYIGYRYDLLQNISSWLQGSFAMILQGRYELLYISIPMLIIALIYADRFTVASMGSDFSKNLGISYKQVVNIGILISALITAVVTSTIGTIPFVGMIIPNIVRIYRGDNFKSSIFEISLLGALFLLICDILSRVLIYPFEIPISVIVGIIGGIFFLYLILQKTPGAKRRSHV